MRYLAIPSVERTNRGVQGSRETPSYTTCTQPVLKETSIKDQKKYSSEIKGTVFISSGLAND